MNKADFLIVHQRGRRGEEGNRVAINLNNVDCIMSDMDERGFYSDIHSVSGHGFIVYESFEEVMKLLKEKH